MGAGNAYTPARSDFVGDAYTPANETTDFSIFEYGGARIRRDGDDVLYT